MTDQGTCVVAGCTKPGTNRLLHEDEQRALTVRATLCEEHIVRAVEVMPAAEIERLLSEVSRDFAGAHVNAGVVIGAVRKALRERRPLDENDRRNDG